MNQPRAVMRALRKARRWRRRARRRGESELSYAIRQWAKELLK